MCHFIAPEGLKASVSGCSVNSKRDSIGAGGVFAMNAGSKECGQSTAARVVGPANNTSRYVSPSPGISIFRGIFPYRCLARILLIG